MTSETHIKTHYVQTQFAYECLLSISFSLSYHITWWTNGAIFIFMLEISFRQKNGEKEYIGLKTFQEKKNLITDSATHNT